MLGKTDGTKGCGPASTPRLTRVSGRLLLLDGHSLAYRAFYALPPENFSTTTGQPTNAVYGFTSMLINALRDEQPTHVAVAFDRAAPTFRHQEYADYKANRSKAPDEFRPQVDLIREVLDALQIQQVAMDGYEADDLIATLASQAEAEGFEVLVVTGDRDVLQLVDEHVTALMTRRGISDMTRFDPAAVREKYGLTPEQYPDFAAVRGDPSDNLPNIPGVGEKTAAKWIREFGSLDVLTDRVDEVPGKAGEKLRDHLAQVLQNRRLTQLDRNVPLGVEVDVLRWEGWDRDAVHQLFDTLQFRVLRERLAQALPNPEHEGESRPEVTGRVLEPGEVQKWLASLGSYARPDEGSCVGLVVRGHWGSGTGDVTGLAIAAEGADEAAYLVAESLTPADEAALAEWLADPSVPKALHDGKGPLLALWARGWDLGGVVCDTVLAAYLVTPGQRTFDLSDLCLRYLGWDPAEVSGADDSDQLTLDGGEAQADAEAAVTLGAEARAVADLAHALGAELQRREGSQLLSEVEMPLERVLARMEAAGVAVDRPYLEELQAELATSVREVEKRAHEVVGRTFNLSSPKQLQQILFEEMALPKTKKIKTGYSTDSDSLLSLLEKSPDTELLHLLLRHRDVNRLKTVVESLLGVVRDDGRIHTTFQQTVAATGRLSSTDPNLQNIPIRTAEGRRIRQAFVVGSGLDGTDGPDFESLMTADYSQIEMRIMAHLSGDPKLIEAFTSGEDLHTYVASQAYAVPVEEVTAEQRRKIKAMSYGLAYGLSAFGLSQQLRITPEEARDQMDRYFERFGKVRDYLHDVVERARLEGYTETLLGRRRYLPDLTSDNRQRRQMAERMALNAPIQGSAADIVKVAMLRVDRRIDSEGLRSRMLLQVHDELVLEVAKGEREPVETVLREEMSGAFDLDVPLEVGIGVGRTWDEAAH